jgi:uncharacterized protein with GYD domain
MYPARRRRVMAKYLLKASYTTDGVKGVLKDGGTGRRAAVEQTVEGLGGSLECFYFAFGEDDAIVIADLPDNQTAAAISMVVNAAGGAQVSTVPLLTPEEADEATKKSVEYRSPGT